MINLKIIRRTFYFVVLIVSQGCFVLIPFIENQPKHDSNCCSKNKVYTDSINTRQTKRSSSKIALLLKDINSPDCAKRTRAATELGMLKSHARTAIEPLSQAIRQDECKWMRRASVKALAKISKEPEVIKTLKHASKDKDKWVAHSAQRCLKDIGA